MMMHHYRQHQHHLRGIPNGHGGGGCEDDHGHHQNCQHEPCDEDEEDLDEEELDEEDEEHMMNG